jgi:cell wall-associated NlpC family hydrolase
VLGVVCRTGIAAFLFFSVSSARAGRAPEADHALTITLPSAPAAPAPVTSTPAVQATLPAPDFSHLTAVAIGAINQDGVQLERRSGDGVQILYTCRSGQNIGIAGQIGEWYCVIMADNTLGCVLAERVDLIWQREITNPTAAVTTETPEIRWQGHIDSSTDSPGSSDGPGLAPLPGAGGSPAGVKAVEYARRYLGVPYRWGGNTTAGIDCSGLMKAAFAEQGVDLPRTAREQALVGIPVSPSDLQPGDRLSFACHGSTIDHTGLYLGDGEFIHASGAKGQVCISKLDGFMKWLVAAHRDIR